MRHRKSMSGERSLLRFVASRLSSSNLIQRNKLKHGLGAHTAIAGVSQSHRSPSGALPNTQRIRSLNTDTWLLAAARSARSLAPEQPTGSKKHGFRYSSGSAAISTGLGQTRS